MHKLWVVLKVSLTRPWVWLMMFFVMIFGGLQLLPHVLALQLRASIENKPAWPGFDRQLKDAPQLQELQQLARDRKLGSVEILSTQNIPGLATLNEAGALVTEPDVQPRLMMVENQPVPFGVVQDQWPLLDQLPQLKALFMQPPNEMGPEGWRRIGRLSQLEELTLADVAAIHPDAMKTAPNDLHAALVKLAKLRQLNLQNTCGSCDWELPPLPKLEYVILGGNKKLESSLETLAKHSPKLHTLSLSTPPSFGFTDRMLDALRQMPNLQRVYVSSSVRAGMSDETQRQVEFLRTRLPGIAIYRGDYSSNRLMICGTLFVFAGILAFVAWLQAGLTLAQPLAAVMPGHRGPHLFWPVGTSLCAILFTTAVALNVGAKLPPALALACLFSTWMSTLLQGHDIRPDWRRITNLVFTVDVLSLLVLIGMRATSISAVDGFLMGDYPLLANLLMLWFLFGAVWKFVRASRLDRILAESGMPGIPGLNLGTQHMYDQPYKPAPGWSMTSWQWKRMGNAIDRRIAGMDRTSWAAMLRAGAPNRLGIGFGVIMMGFVFLIGHSMKGIRPVSASNPNELQVMVLMQAAMQASLMLLIVNLQSWIGRRDSIAADFLRPVSREKYWAVLRIAIFQDLKPSMLFALVGGALANYNVNNQAISTLGVLLTIISVTGCFAFIHAWVVKLLISKRQAVDSTLALVTSMVVVGMSVAAVSMRKDLPTAPAWVPVVLALCVLACGGWMQRDLARKLPDWELG